MSRVRTNLLLGVTGFVGRNLAAHLARMGEPVFGSYRHPPGKSILDPRIRLVRLDVTQRYQLERSIRRCSPDRIYYLAAQSSVREAWEDPVRTLQVNFLGGVYLLEILRRQKRKAKVLIFSSGTTYGLSHESGKSLSETAGLLPRDPYSVSKSGIDFFARLCGKVYHLPVVVVRLANVLGSGQSPAFSISNFAYQIAGMEAGRLPKILQVGNLKAQRDYLDIRDCVRALHLAMKFGESGEAYNIASGTSRTLGDVLHQMVELSGLRGRRLKMVPRKSLRARDEIAAVRLNASKFRKLTGWKPLVPLRQSLTDVLEYWRSYWHEARN